MSSRMWYEDPEHPTELDKAIDEIVASPRAQPFLNAGLLLVLAGIILSAVFWGKLVYDSHEMERQQPLQTGAGKIGEL